MTWFRAFRNVYGFTQYEDYRSAVTYDKPLMIITYVCAFVAVATLIATLGIRGRERWSSTIRASYAVAIGSIILACLFGFSWQEGSLKIKSPYVYRNNLPFEGYVGLKVALNSANVTLDGVYQGASGPVYVYYAESIPWPDFGQESQSYLNFLRKGLPDPILKVMAFVTQDEGNFRWGRTFHTSGYFAMVLLWTSFAFWIISNVLLCSVIVYGAYMFTLTGLTMILASVTYHVCQCPLSLVIRFNDNNLQMSYGWSFWLTLAAGSLTFVLGLLLTLLDRLAHEAMSELFNLEKLTDDGIYEFDKTDPGNEGAEVASTSSSELNRYRMPVPSIHNGLKTGRSGRASGSSDAYGKVNPIYCDDGQDESFGGSRRRNGVVFPLKSVSVESEAPRHHSDTSLSSLEEGRVKHVYERMSSTSSESTDKQGKGNKKQRETEAPNGILYTNISQREPSFDSSSMQAHTGLSIYPTDEQLESVSGFLVSDNLHQREQSKVFETSDHSPSKGIVKGPDTGKGVSSDFGIDGGEVNDGYESDFGSKSGNTFHESNSGKNTDTIVNIL